MSEISTGQEVKDVVRFCPECGSPSIETQTVAILSGDSSKVGCTCTACSWTGVVGDLLSVPFTHELGGKENIMHALMGDLRMVMARYAATPIGAFLLKWGFLTEERFEGQRVLNRAQLSRYMTAATKAVLLAVIEERRKMEQERINGS